MKSKIIDVLQHLARNEDEITKILFEGTELQIISYFDQRCFNLYYDNNYYSKLLNRSKFTFYADGTGLRFAIKFLLKKNINVFNSSDFNESLFKKFISKSTPLFILGGDFDSSWIQQKATKKGINLAGYHHGYFDDLEFPDIKNNIKANKSRIIVIGMGIPRQEIIADKLKDIDGVDIILCVGNFLEFYFGTVKRAPQLLRNSGLEWVHRLLIEPKRLWKRYLLGIPVFIYRILIIKLSLLVYKMK